MNKIIDPLLFDDFNEACTNTKLIIDRFNSDGVVCIRGTKPTRTQQMQITTLLGDHLGWFPNSTSEYDTDHYSEDHSSTLSRSDKHNLGANDLAVCWHIEHCGTSNPAIAATWNMEKFTCSNEFGRTSFVDCSKIYDMLDNQDKHFLDVCKFSLRFNDDENKSFVADSIQPHRISNKKTIRITPSFIYDSRKFIELVSVDGKNPTPYDSENFFRIIDWFSQTVCTNEDIRITHKWEQGDLVIPDLFLMAHAVFGGFKPSDRQFFGCWARLNKV